VLPSFVEYKRGESMSNKKRVSLAVVTLILSTTLISACTQSLSQAPAVTPTLIATGLFVSPFPSVENPMAMIEEFAKQTSAAQTVAAGGVAVTGTPGTPISGATVTGTPATPLSGITNTPGVALTTDVSTPTNANAAATTAVVVPAATNMPPANSTPVPAGVRPASYTLQYGEFPYCIARRFNVDPEALLSASGLTSPDLYYPGLVLKIPQSGAFPGERMLASHPATYTVATSDETLFSIACKYGDVEPGALASANGLSTGATLSVGQQIRIP
jgi:LysM repeat protein